MLSQVDKDGSNSVDAAEFFAIFLQEAQLDAHALAARWASMGAVDTGSDLCTVPPPPSMSLWRFVFAGGIGGVVSRTCTAPLERLAILSQTRAEGVQGGMRATLQRVLVREGVRGDEGQRDLRHEGEQTLESFTPSDQPLRRRGIRQP